MVTKFEKPVGTEIGNLASLATTDKSSVVGAINSLNSNLSNYRESDGTLKQLDSVNLNSITQSGRYYIKGSSTNRPEAVSGYLDVYYVNSTVAKQVFRPSNSDNEYERTLYGSTWGDWYSLNNNKAYYEQIANNTNLNNILASGLYRSPATISDVETLSNCPADTPFTMIVTGSGTTTMGCVQTVIKEGKIYVRRGTSTGFGSWYLFTGTAI